MEAKMVLPGDEIATAEEFEPGEGTYEKNGLVFAATPGVLVLDPGNRDLYCPRDERTEQRKLAADYADLRLFVPASELGGGTIPEKHRGGRGEGADRGGRDRGGRGGGRDRPRDRGGGGRGRDGRSPRGGGRDRDRGRHR